MGEVNWSVAAATFPITVQPLALPEYSYHTLLGIVASCGGLSESTVCDISDDVHVECVFVYVCACR